MTPVGLLLWQLNSQSTWTYVPSCWAERPTCEKTLNQLTRHKASFNISEGVSICQAGRSLLHKALKAHKVLCTIASSASGFSVDAAHNVEACFKQYDFSIPVEA